jgi:hypothetical protein
MLGPLRKKLAAQQRNTCPITGQTLGSDIVADHDHKTGMIRGVLPRWVNSVLGRLENWANRVGNGTDPVQFLRGCADYIEYHRDHPSGLIYPTHKTPEERKAATALRAKLRRKKRN